MEGRVNFTVIPTPSYEPFQTVTVMALVAQVGGAGSASITKELSIQEARTFAQEIEKACQIVERDR